MHMPQFATSPVVSTQAPLHPMVGAVQVKPQVLAAQVGVPFAGAPQTLPQPPQLEVLLAVSTQPLQSVVPDGHMPVVHLPAAQTAPAPHVVMQSPQCILSELKSTQ